MRTLMQQYDVENEDFDVFNYAIESYDDYLEISITQGDRKVSLSKEALERILENVKRVEAM